MVAKPPFPYIHTTLFFFSIFVGVILFLSGVLHEAAFRLSPLGYVGALINGFFFSTALTSAISSFMFVELGGTLAPLPTAILGGLGAMLSDLLLYRFFRNRLFGELHLLGNRIFSSKKIKRFILFLQKPWLRWLLPICGVVIISSPLPDELGVALFGLAGVQLRFLSPITFLANAVGIFFLVTVGSIA